MVSLSWLIAGPLLYLAVAVFIVVAAYKIICLAKMPRQIRWDIYPLPHRGKAGSKYQKVDFAQQHADFSLSHELLEMAEEILLIKRLFKNNFPLWVGSYALHAGIYVGAAWIVLLLAGAVCQISGITSNSFTTYLFSATTAVGGTALVLGLAGSIYLLLRRLLDSDMRTMSDRVSYVNLWLMIAVFGSGLAAWLGADSSFNHLRDQVGGLITFKPIAPSNPLIAVEFFFFSLFLMYLPFSRMLHFAAKYFFYHNIMWDDEAMTPGSKLEQERLKQLGYQLQWAAPHIKANRSWLDQLANDKAEEGKKSK